MTMIALVQRNRPWVLRLLALFCLCLGALWPARAVVEPLTNASAVLGLAAAEARSGIPISVTGVVTAAETNWNGRFFVQDYSAGVFVENRSNAPPIPGDVVAVTGISHPGGYAPIITKPQWHKLGVAPLPEAKPVTAECLMSGSEDSQRIEISGIVRTAKMSGSRMGIEVASGGWRFRAYFPPAAYLEPQSLVGAKVLLRGTAAAAFNAPLRHFLTVTLFLPQPEDFMVEVPAPADPFADPPSPLNNIAQYRRDRPAGSQIHVQGVVTFQRTGESLFLRDATGGLQVKTTLTNSVLLGEMVEAVGFPAVENYLPVLEDAVFRKTATPRLLLEPTNPPVADFQKGLHHADFVLLRGRLLDRLVKGIGQGVNGPALQTTLVLQASNTVFVVEKDAPEPNDPLSAIPIGSLVEARGICFLDSSDSGKIKSFRLLLPTSHDVRILEKPGWLTPRHLLASLVAAMAVLFAAIGWTAWVAKKNSLLKLLVQEKEAAQQELQQAHDQLEERVRERSAQLKVEMTARKESELQFRAILAERTRLAQELHDTLEQTLVGIALQQDLVAAQIEKHPGDASHHLKLARSLMRQGQEDLHRSVWGLRSRTEEDFNLTNALLSSARQISGVSGLRIESKTSGATGPLSEIVEDNLLRIGMEAVTNAVKHSGAAHLVVEWQFQPGSVVLKISDDGRGFEPATCAGPKEGHFGLLGIRERTERLGGRLQINSVPGRGASIRVEIPSVPANEAAPLPANQPHETRT